MGDLRPIFQSALKGSKTIYFFYHRGICNVKNFYVWVAKIYWVKGKKTAVGRGVQHIKVCIKKNDGFHNSFYNSIFTFCNDKLC